MPSGKSKLAVADRREIAVHHVIGNLGQTRWSPLRVAVPLDQHCPDALVEVVAGHDVLGEPVFEAAPRRGRNPARSSAGAR